MKSLTLQPSPPGQDTTDKTSPAPQPFTTGSTGQDTDKVSVHRHPSGFTHRQERVEIVFKAIPIGHANPHESLVDTGPFAGGTKRIHIWELNGQQIKADISREKASEGLGSPWAFILETGKSLVLVALGGSVPVSISRADAPSWGKGGEWAVAQGTMCHHLKANGSRRTLVPQ